MNDIKVYSSPLPFSNRQERGFAAPGSSLQEIVDSVVPARYWPAGVGAIVEINGHQIRRKYWSRVRPKMGTIVDVRVVMQGGKGKKNPLVSLLSIAVMIAAPYVAGAILGPTLAATQVGIGALTYGGLLSAGIGMVGRLLISALAPPPKPSKAGAGDISNPTESPTQFIEGAKNSLNPYGVVPICLGTNRMFPLQAARPYTETQNNDQYVRQLFTYGYGQKMVISDLRIGETSLTEFTDFELEHRLEGDLHEGTTLYTNDVFQEDYSILLEQVAGFTLRSTQEETDEAVVDITFPRGLCSYNTQGARLSYRVQLELQYAPSGTSDWSPAASTFKAFSGASFTLADVSLQNPYNPSQQNYNGTRTDTICVDQYSGVIYVVQGQSGFTQAQPIPANAIRLATLQIDVTKNQNTGVVTTNVTKTDVRQASWFGTLLEDSNSFVVTNVGLNVTVSGGGILVNDLDILGNQTEALRKSVRVVFPAKGKYDFRIRRLTGDSTSDQVFDKVYLSAIKSVKYQSPVKLHGINGSACRIKATDQLNGALDQFNVLASNVILDFNDVLGGWEERATSNPAALFRYVLQGPANARPLPDSKINLDDIEDWHRHCSEQGYTYNRVIDYDTSVEEILRDIAAAGAASPTVVDGKRTVVIDRIKDDIVQIITPRNSWGYSGEMIYPDLPHAFRVQFRNADKGYNQDERIVYDDGYNETNATQFEMLELQSCTNADLAFKTGRRHIASGRLRPELHTFMMDVENLVAVRGDRIKLEHDAPIIGVGDGRIKEVLTDGGSPELVAGITIDDTVSIPSVSTYYVRIRLADGTQLYKEILTTPGNESTFMFAEPFALVDSPAQGDLCYFVEAGHELDLIITRIEPQADLTARITAVNYAPEVFTAESAEIPPFNSNITTPLEFIRPVAPELLDEQSDENVMLVNSDGSFTPRAIFTLKNLNDGDVQVNVRVRVAGTTAWTNANVLESTPERLIITGLDDGKRYDIHIRYRRAGASMMSLPLQLNGYLFIGASGLPDDVTGFLINIAGETALLKWDANDDIDLAFYRIKFTTARTGATWATAQILEDRVYENRLSTTFQPGTYLIKAVDRLGYESETATAIITFDPESVRNVVETLVENPTFHGVKDNVVIDDNSIVLADTSLGIGYYYFNDEIDLTDRFLAYISADVRASGAFVNNLFIVDDIFGMDDVFGSGANDIFAEPDVFGMDDVFGIGADGWDIQLQYRITDDDPALSPGNWGPWQEFVAGNVEFRAIQFRIRLRSFAQNISPRVSVAIVSVDMPDRIERGEDLTCPEEGITITYTPDFKNNPAVAITIQDGDANDEPQVTGKTPSGFTLMVYNTTLGSYVERTFDYISSGYGRKNE